jgi:hypothetical protein
MDSAKFPISRISFPIKAKNFPIELATGKSRSRLESSAFLRPKRPFGMPIDEIPGYFPGSREFRGQVAATEFAP